MKRMGRTLCLFLCLFFGTMIAAGFGTIGGTVSSNVGDDSNQETENTIGQNELLFRGLQFGVSYPNCKDTIIDGLKKDGYESALHEFSNKVQKIDYHYYYTPAGAVDVAGYDSSVYFGFSYPQGHPEDETYSKFALGFYMFNCTTLHSDEIINDLLQKLTDIYGEPATIASTESVLQSYTWKDFTNNACVSLTLQDTADSEYEYTILIYYSSLDEEIAGYKIMTPDKDNNNGL